MIRSLYIMNYFENMKKWYTEQEFIFDNWNDTDNERRDDGVVPGRDLFYVPRSQSEHMVEELVRFSLTRSVKEPGEPWLYLGWNTSPMKALDGTRSHIVHRRVPIGDYPTVRKPEGIPEGSRQTKWYRECTFDLSVFMMTNYGNIAEDLEEAYEACIQMRSDYPVDLGSVFIFDYPDFRVNTQHKTVQTSNPILPNKGNLWGLGYDVTITGPVLEFGEKQMAACKAVSVQLYEMTKNRPMIELVKTKEES